MPPTLQFPWLNKGDAFELPDIPMAGDDELDKLTERYAKTLVLQKQSYLLQRVLAILAVKRLVDMGHPDRAIQAWKEALPMVEPPKSRSLYEWTDDKFVSEFEAYFHIEIEQRYNVEGYDAANAFLQDRLRKLEEDSKDLQIVQGKEFQKERLVTDLFWRLKSQFKTLTLDDQEVPLTRENLRQVLRIPTDWNAYLEALAATREEKGQEREREEFLEELDEPGLKKNSGSIERSGRQSKTGTPSTSARGSATAKP